MPCILVAGLVGNRLHNVRLEDTNGLLGLVLLIRGC